MQAEVYYYKMMHEHIYNHPTTIVVFGGTGDLAQSKLFPALLDLFIEGALPDSFIIIGLSRKEMSDSEYQNFIFDSISKKAHLHAKETVKSFCEHLRYVAGNFDNLGSYEKIKTTLNKFDDSIKQCTNKLFYLAVPPQYYEVIFEHLNFSKVMALCDGVESWSRLLVEKPFGKDLLTAQSLEKRLCELFSDEQIYRIDHYLAKDAIENIISLRFANSILADSWNKEHIELIEIKLFETNDVSNRGSFYDGIGTLRDVGQNHMLQIFALLTMEKVNVHSALSVRKARFEALNLLLNQKPDTVIRGQYEGFAETKGVQPDTQTETYFKIAFTAQALLWEGVRFTLEAGKALDNVTNEVIVTFKSLDECQCSFAKEAHTHKNILKIQFSPEQRIVLSLWMKKPGFVFELEEREFLLLVDKSNETHSPEAYERVLFDCIAGDQTRFVSGDELEASWQFITPILKLFESLPLYMYKQNSKGPILKAYN